MAENVQITFVDLSSNVSKNHPSDDTLREYLDLQSILETCRTAQEDLAARANSSERGGGTLTANMKEDIEPLENRLKTKIRRFMRCVDRYTALTSLLLKSQAYHLTFPKITGEEATRPVIDLPRSLLGKPFLPSSATSLDENIYPLSISHQFPFVGMARLLCPNNKNASDPLFKNEYFIGLDIVTFDEINPKLYASVDEFVLAFRGTFTRWEWNTIQNSTTDAFKLREFYVRWAMKESYTKALGLGMSLDFNSFETRVQNIDDDPVCGGGGELWPLISSSSAEDNKGTTLFGSITLDVNTPKQRTEEATFFFLPLKVNGEIIGCASVCLTTCSINSNIISPRIEWTTLEKLVQWHVESSVEKL